MYNYGYNNYNNQSSILEGIFAMFGAFFLISAVIGIITLISQWKIYKKAGKKGWECLIPIYNIIVLLQIVELPLWYLVLFIIPFANIYAMFKIYIELAHKFGKSTGFGVATVFFSFVCLPILAFGKENVYNGNNATNNNQPTPVLNPNNMFDSQNTSGMENNNINYNNPYQTTTVKFNQNMNEQANNIQTFQNNGNMNINNQVNQMQQPEINQYTSTSPMVNPRPQMNSYDMTPPVNNQQPELNVIPNMEMPQQTMNPNNISNNLNNQINSVQQPIMGNQNTMAYGNQPTQQINPQPQINVIPNMGTIPQPVMPNQNTENNQNNSNM